MQQTNMECTFTFIAIRKHFSRLADLLIFQVQPHRHYVGSHHHFNLWSLAYMSNPAGIIAYAILYGIFGSKRLLTSGVYLGDFQSLLTRLN